MPALTDFSLGRFKFELEEDYFPLYGKDKIMWHTQLAIAVGYSIVADIDDPLMSS